MKKILLLTVAALASLVIAGCQSHEGGAGNEYNTSTGTSAEPNYNSPATNHSSEANMPPDTNAAPESPKPAPAPGGGAGPANP